MPRRAARRAIAAACFGGVFGAVFAGAARAQAPAPAPATGQFVVGGGLDLSDGYWNRAQNPGLALQAGYERRLGRSRVGLRLEGTYWRQRASSFGVLSDADLARGLTGAGLFRTVQIGGLNVLGTYQFAPAARVRPYALAGVGYQRLSEGRRFWLAGSPEAVAAAGLPPAGRAPVNSLAYTGGLGLAVPLGRGALFAEGRVTGLPGGNSGPPFDGIRGNVTPITVGFRF